MSDFHLIAHYGKYLHRREDYTAICEGDDCASQILDLMEYWTKCRISEIQRVKSYNVEAKRNKTTPLKVPDTWLYERIDDFKQGLMDGYGETYIKSRLKLLKDKGFIDEKESRNKFDKTRYYRFNVNSVQEAIDEWRKSKMAEALEKFEQTNLTVDESEVSLEETNLVQEQSNLTSLHCSSNSQSNIPLPLPPLTKEEERERKFGFEIPEGSAVKDGQTFVEQKVKTIMPVNDLSTGTNVPARPDPFFQKHHDPSVVVWNWLPDGPWKTEDGKLDPNFQTELARRWVEEHGGDLHTKRANVLKHFKNDPTNLPIEWEWYQGKYLHVAANVQLRKLGGVDTTIDEQKIIKHVNAFKSLPEELRVTPSQSAERIIEEVAPHALPVVQSVPAALPEGAESPESYRVFQAADDHWVNLKAPQPQPKKEPVSSEEKAKAIAAIEELKKQRDRKKGSLTKLSVIVESPKEDFYAVLEDMRKYLNSGSDVCRQIAIDWASDPKNGCELVRRSGQIVDIREMEF